MNEVTHTQHFETTYHGKKRTIIKRRRICRHCGLPFNTVETYEDEENTNLPEDIQPFRPPPPPTGVYCPPVIPVVNPIAAEEDSLPSPKKPPASAKEKKPKRSR